MPSTKATQHVLLKKKSTKNHLPLPVHTRGDQDARVEMNQHRDRAGSTGGVLLMLSVYSLCWYFTSSQNAVATQEVIQSYKEEHKSSTDNQHHLKNMFTLMTCLTASQLCVGFGVVHLIAFILRYGVCTASRSVPEMLEPLQDFNKKWFTLGLLHFFGTLFTNLGVSYGSACVVQVVKLLEPVQTLLLLFLVDKFGSSVHHIMTITTKQIIGVLFILLGTSLLLWNGTSEKGGNTHAILFAILSGFSLSSRNVLQKVWKHRNVTPTKLHTNTSSTVYLPTGLKSFSKITAHAMMPSLVFFLLGFCFGPSHQWRVVCWILSSSGKSGFQAIVFHGIYNIASLSVLHLVSAQTHSLLNVGKRIFNVVFASLVFHQPIELRGLLGISLALIGGYIYSKGNPSITSLSYSCCLRMNVCVGQMMMLLVILMILSNGYVHHTRNLFVLSSLNLRQDIGFNLFDVEWPLTAPVLKTGCKVMFRNKQLSVCYITPYRNFGDELGPPIVKRILELHFQCSADDLSVFDLKDIYQGGGDYGFLNRTGSKLDTCLMAVGSLWRMVKSNDHLWGTGVAYNGTVQDRCQPKPRHLFRKVENITVYSSRGPLSAEQIRKYCEPYKNAGLPTIEGAGDAGFLVPFLFPELDLNNIKTNKGDKKKICFVPHKKDEKNNAWKSHQLNSTPKLLKVNRGWVNMTQSLQSCDVVISSSLHGIILAEAMGIPSKRMRLSANPGDFKFSDFYMSFRGTEPESLAKIDSASINAIPKSLSYSERDTYAKRVIKTFPLHLFHAVETNPDNKY